ncbi:unnamed protein product [Mytilus edulis]|uniref:Uncharacterized protein n=1 Tax=Mytilus edulis TaxID=6550 RepID=A0A8S3TAH1_MYTED|nr:unnamed protein product [Mytilus edulis]
MFNKVDDMAERKLNGDNRAPTIESCNGDDEILDVQALKKNPLFSPFFNHLEMEQKKLLNKLEIPYGYLMTKDSVQAFFHLTVASQILEGYTKDRIDDTKDCDALSPAFENIVRGYLLENSMFDPFRPPEKTSVLVDQYLNLRPQDICAEYVKVIILS